MLHQGKVIAALENKADRFSGYDAALQDSLAAYERSLADLAQMSRAQVDARLSGVPWPGARPTQEHDQHPGVIVPFAESWTNHEQARAWARKVLQGTPTIAVDGSQITPTKDVSLPVGAVQIGWFANPHAENEPYVKDITFEVLAPDELSGDSQDPSAFPDWRINVRRFVGECEKLIDFMESAAPPPRRDASQDAARSAPPAPICLFDGSLVVSFAGQMKPERQRRYVEAVERMLRVSEERHVPLVGYVDTSYATDLAVMFDVLSGRPHGHVVSDGALLSGKMQWGDRSTAFICARDDSVLPVRGTKYYDHTVFVYLKTTADRPPARLDLPRWLVEAGELERVVDVVRAECVVGNGYPYALETADAVAVITMQDRQRFYRVLQEFAEKRNLPLRWSRKMVSKEGRR